MGIRGILAALPYAIKKDMEDEVYRSYVTRGVRILTENTAKYVGGGYIKAEFDDMIKPANTKEVKEGEAKAKILSKLSS